MKKVMCIETGRAFYSMGDAADFAGVAPHNISDAVRGVTKTAGGYHWRYADAAAQPVKQEKPKSRPGMTIHEVQEEARRRTEETGRLVRYADIQKEETMRLIRERDRQMRERAARAERAARVRHGEWEFFTDCYRCSECSAYSFINSAECPTCGAKMDGKGDGK